MRSRRCSSGFWASGRSPPWSNNAAGNFLARSEELSPRAVDAVLGIMLKGSINCTLASRPPLACGRPGTVLSVTTTYA